MAIFLLELDLSNKNYSYEIKIINNIIVLSYFQGHFTQDRDLIFSA